MDTTEESNSSPCTSHVAAPVGNRTRRTRTMSCAELSRERTWERRRLIKSCSDVQARMERLNSFDSSSSSSSRTSFSNLTEEDYEELKGCIDLGFRFDEESPELCNTLPALEVCYAVNKNFQDVQQGSSPRLIFNPSDDLEEVKDKLRHWAKAVACISRQSR